jgi:hypothetical protein
MIRRRKSCWQGYLKEGKAVNSEYAKRDMYSKDK